jgi:DNA-binding NarL/FixJ family response regulator
MPQIRRTLQSTSRRYGGSLRSKLDPRAWNTRRLVFAYPDRSDASFARVNEHHRTIDAPGPPPPDGHASGLRILIADGHELFREGVATLLRSKPEVAVAECVGMFCELSDRVSALRPDVLLLDLHVERPMLPEIPALATRTRVLVVTSIEQYDRLLAAMRAGARGVVSKGVTVETLMAAVRAVTRGDVWLGPELQTRLVSAFAESSNDHLTAREREIVRLAALGMRNAEIASELFISPVTVKTHLGHVFEKLGVRDRSDLVLYAVRAGLISVDEEKR